MEALHRNSKGTPHWSFLEEPEKPAAPTVLLQAKQDIMLAHHQLPKGGQVSGSEI
jgi:hypothetical protein